MFRIPDDITASANGFVIGRLGDRLRRRVHGPLTEDLVESQVRDLYEPVAGWESVAAAYREFGRSPDVQSRPSVMTMGPPLVPGQDTRVQFRVKGASVPICDATGAFLYTAGHSYMYLWSINKGVPIGLVALDWLSKRRVALTAAVGIAELGRRDIDKIVLFGAGPWARQTCEVLAEQWPEADVVVVTAHPENSVAFAATMPDNVVAGVDARSGMRGADAAVTLTNATEPFIHEDYLEPGALLLSMGNPHEVDVEVLRQSDALLVDDLAYARFQGDIAAWLKRGDLDETELAQRLRANIGEVLAGLKPGRMREDERLVTVLQGLTACDVAIAKAMLDRGEAESVGHLVGL